MLVKRLVKKIPPPPPEPAASSGLGPLSRVTEAVCGALAAAGAARALEARTHVTWKPLRLAGFQVQVQVNCGVSAPGTADSESDSESRAGTWSGTDSDLAATMTGTADRPRRARPAFNRESP